MLKMPDTPNIIMLVLIIVLVYVFISNISNGNNSTYEHMGSATPFKIPYLRIPKLDITQSFNILPKGSIVMWGGSASAIPFGWVICDGRSVLSDGTVSPNLVDYFVKAGTKHEVGNPSLKATGTTPNDGAHAHAGTSTGSVNLLKSFNVFACSIKDTKSAAYSSGLSTNSSGEHTHPITIDTTNGSTTGSATLDWYSLIFIVKA